MNHTDTTSALRAFVALAEQRSRELGGLSEEMEKCLRDGRAALARVATLQVDRAVTALTTRGLLPLTVDVNTSGPIHVTSLRDARGRQWATINPHLEDRSGIAALLAVAVNGLARSQVQEESQE